MQDKLFSAGGRGFTLTVNIKIPAPWAPPAHPAVMGPGSLLTLMQKLWDGPQCRSGDLAAKADPPERAGDVQPAVLSFNEG